MVLEDEIPTRPSGFCNVNQLFEVNIAQADQIVVLRGPGTVTYGSNALHGAIDVLTPGPSGESFSEYAFEAGTDDYYRGRTEGNKTVLFRSDNDLTGRVLPVRVTLADSFTLHGELVEAD